MSRTADFRFNGVVRLTRIGAGYLVFTFLIAFAAINTGNNSLYIGLAFMLGALLISGVASRGGLRHLKLEVSQVDQAWAGRSVGGMLHAFNDSRLWNVRDVVITSNELARPALVPILDRRSGRGIPATFIFSRRGRAELSHLDLYTRYPFALFLKKRRVRISTTLIVYPRLLESKAQPEPSAPDRGETMQSVRAGLGTELHGFRDYVRGDSVRQIHWKKSASLGRWILKETEAEIDRGMHLCVDAFLPHERTEDEFEQMISEATTLAHDLLRDGVRVTLTAGDATVSANDDQSSAPLFELLALLAPSRQPAELPEEADAVVFTLRRR